ncbi:holo-ACP synthase [Formivibrio citricus]|uniref:citrate lyase holo-[acyl-carrier protein] synthase n=1 Tax=Formivibrio citricus TaxID=83765 RepID=A0A1I5CEX8_9NEIS|nr:citrate lyase holo-[acyl-carrier protein] synthase [Formivibrio citricus]SFN85191.1 holo-ACP synthase [Formivibrio citricus]
MKTKEVSLEEILAARDSRVERQQAALARWRLPLVSLTLVMPGPLKDSDTARFLLDEAIAEVDALCRDRGWVVRSFEAIRQPTGPEALYAVDTDAQTLKRALTGLEEQHALGRLWDMDVIDPVEGSLSRRSLGLESRRCLVCDEPGHACARSRAHPLPELMAAIKERVDGYRHRRAA